MTQPAPVLVVSGPPGAGKSTVARMYADRLSLSVHLHTDDFWANIRRGVIPPYLPQSHRQNEIVVDVLVGAALGYARGGYEVVVDGVVGPWFIDRFVDGAHAAGVPLHYVVLRPDEPTTLARATARGPEALTDPEPLRSMYAEFADLDCYESHVLDSSRLDADNTVDEVARLFSAGVLRLDSAA
ncbi:MAG TPA: AAA family ATPase [Stackebrandtia sp.]|uniref:AAA family ATPase n=1 Tax=Stackebrandtia sp. TaxID=2023065 RepID=UPI002D68918F|nr:AAA family ATPase [Stackebrandtia sp.]HZE40577.1 AAA family ATPase [Stackebrandtia sp.]